MGHSYIFWGRVQNLMWSTVWTFAQILGHNDLWHCSSTTINNFRTVVSIHFHSQGLDQLVCVSISFFPFQYVCFSPSLGVSAFVSLLINPSEVISPFLTLLSPTQWICIYFFLLVCLHVSFSHLCSVLSAFISLSPFLSLSAFVAFSQCVSAFISFSSFICVSRFLSFSVSIYFSISFYAFVYLSFSRCVRIYVSLPPCLCICLSLPPTFGISVFVPSSLLIICSCVFLFLLQIWVPLGVNVIA